MTKFRISECGKRIITVDTMVNGKGPFNFAVDTGASHTVISNQAAEKLGLNNSSPGCCESATRSAQGAGGPVAARATTVESVKVGDIEAKNVEVALVDLTSLSKTWDGIIGYTFMKDYKVVIDYPRQEISFEKA
jgi:clan AA aspartic protease (TIGR02281 family)